MHEITLRDKTIEKLMEASLMLAEDMGYCTDYMWHTKDIHNLCRMKNWPEIAEEHAKAIFKIYVAMNPRDNNVTWQKLADTVETYLIEKNLLKKEVHVDALESA